MGTDLRGLGRSTTGCAMSFINELTRRNIIGVAIAYIVTAWLNFDADSLRFHGVPPADIDDDTWLTVRATNFEGVWTEGRFRLRHH